MLQCHRAPPCVIITDDQFGAKSPISPPSYLGVVHQLLIQMISHFSARQIIATIVTLDNGATSHLAIALEALFDIGLRSDIMSCMRKKMMPFEAYHMFYVGMTTCST
jgi:hypothetical protein